jgi:hypothetical protein
MKKTLELLTAMLLVVGTTQALAAIMTFNAGTAAENAAKRALWLAAAGETADFIEDFETSGFIHNQNIHGTGLTGGLVLRDTSGSALVRTRTAIAGSIPAGALAATHNEQANLVLDFSGTAGGGVSYVGFLDIDHAGVSSTITTVGGTALSFDGTAAGGASGEFFGIVSSGALISTIAMDASGDGLWGVDNIEFGVPAPGAVFILGLALVALGRRARV